MFIVSVKPKKKTVIIVSAIVAAVIGAVFFPVNADDENASSDNTENEVTALHSEEGGAV